MELENAYDVVSGEKLYKCMRKLCIIDKYLKIVKGQCDGNLIPVGFNQ